MKRHQRLSATRGRHEFDADRVGAVDVDYCAEIASSQPVGRYVMGQHDDIERMNELRVYRRDDAHPADEGWTVELSGPAHPFHRNFNPGWGTGLGYDDLKVIEAGQFLQAVVTGVRTSPDFEDAAAVARVQQAIAASWDSGTWERVRPV